MRSARIMPHKNYTTIIRLNTGKVFRYCIPSPAYPDKPVLLIELKYDRAADTALSQVAASITRTGWNTIKEYSAGRG